MGALELADLVGFLPDGCALWRSTGGPRAWSEETHLLNLVEYRLRLLVWQKTEAGRKGNQKPELTKPPAHALEKRSEQNKQSIRATAWEARQARQNRRQ